MSSFSVFAVRNLYGVTAPMLVLDGPDGPYLSKGAGAYVSMLLNRGDPFSRADAACDTLGRLHDFYMSAYGGRQVSPDAIPSIVAGFLLARRNGTIDCEGRDASGLHWHPVRRDTVAKDRAFLSEYADFCLTNLSVQPFGDGVLAYPSEGSDAYVRSLRRLQRNRCAKKNTDLLHHIAHARKPKAVFGIDISERTTAVRAGSRTKTFLPPDVVNEAIDSTKSIVQRMTLILDFFGGPRLSEILHLWRCDVLPGRLRKSLFLDDLPSELPLVVLAHPSQSTYTGEPSSSGEDRLQHLQRKFGLRPRTLLDPDPRWLGWKGMQFDEQGRLISQVFWSDHDRAVEFFHLYARLRSEIYPMVGQEVLASHPYFMINDCPHQPEFGLPMKLSNARKIFFRACRRIGVSPLLYHTGSHGGRHFYKHSLKRLGLDKEDVRKCMHHLSAESQEDYGRSLIFLRKNLEEAMARRSSNGKSR